MKRAKFNGKSVSKFDMASMMDSRNFKHCYWVIMYDAFTYDELLMEFVEFLVKYDLFDLYQSPYE